MVSVNSQSIEGTISRSTKMNTNDTISLDVDIGGYGIELSSIADQP
jgi:hypothetical protein